MAQPNWNCMAFTAVEGKVSQLIFHAISRESSGTAEEVLE